MIDERVLAKTDGKPGKPEDSLARSWRKKIFFVIVSQDTNNSRQSQENLDFSQFINTFYMITWSLHVFYISVRLHPIGSESDGQALWKLVAREDVLLFLLRERLLTYQESLQDRECPTWGSIFPWSFAPPEVLENLAMSTKPGENKRLSFCRSWNYLYCNWNLIWVHEMFMNLEQLYKASVSCTAILFAYLFGGRNTSLWILKIFFYFFFLIWVDLG